MQQKILLDLIMKVEENKWPTWRLSIDFEVNVDNKNIVLHNLFAIA
jgi:hypothetical protein